MTVLLYLTAQKMKFLLRIYLVNVTKSAETVDLVTFTKELRNENLNFLCSVFLIQRKISFTESLLRKLQNSK